MREQAQINRNHTEPHHVHPEANGQDSWVNYIQTPVRFFRQYKTDVTILAGALGLWASTFFFPDEEERGGSLLVNLGIVENIAIGLAKTAAASLASKAFSAQRNNHIILSALLVNCLKNLGVHWYFNRQLSIEQLSEMIGPAIAAILYTSFESTPQSEDIPIRVRQFTEPLQLREGQGSNPSDHPSTPSQPGHGFRERVTRGGSRQRE